MAGCGGSGGDGSSEQAGEQAEATTNEIVECVSRASRESRDNIPDERLSEVAEPRSLEDLSPAPTGYRAFAQSEAVKPPLLELYVFVSSADAKAALAALPEDELPRTSTDLEPNSVGRRGNVVFRFVGGGGPVERVTDQDAIRCLGHLPEPKGAELPAEIAEQGRGLVAERFTAQKPMSLPPAQLEADEHPPVVSVPFERGDDEEVVLAYFASEADWRASIRAMDRTNRGYPGTNLYAACAGRRIYLSLDGRGIRKSDIETAEGSLDECEIKDSDVQ
jgi:hypothetical protein